LLVVLPACGGGEELDGAAVPGVMRDENEVEFVQLHGR
jgi:hypothetical protein